MRKQIQLGETNQAQATKGLRQKEFPRTRCRGAQR